MAVFPYSRPGILGAVLLGLGRALGETMAVTMVIGNSPRDLGLALRARATRLPAVIANEFAEATGDVHVGALAGLGLVLFGLTFLLNALARGSLVNAVRTGPKRSRGMNLHALVQLPRSSWTGAWPVVCAAAARGRVHPARLGALAGVSQGRAGLSLVVLHRAAQAGRRGRRRGRQRASLGTAVHGGPGLPHRAAARDRRRRLPGREGRRHGRAARCASWPRCSRACRPSWSASSPTALVVLADAALLGAGRGGGAGDPHGPDAGPRHRGAGSAGARARCARRRSRSACRPGRPACASSCAPRWAASSPRCCSPSPAPPARPRRCSSPRSTTSTGTCSPISPPPRSPCRSSTTPSAPTTTGTQKAWSAALVLLLVVIGPEPARAGSPCRRTVAGAARDEQPTAE